MCRVQDRSRVGPTLYVRARTIKVAQQRQGLHPEDTSIRAVVESTIRSVKRGFPNNKVPVRGLTRARTMILGAATMVNVRRLHQYFRERAQDASQQLAFSLFSAKKAVCHCLSYIRRHTVHLAQPAVSLPS
jgi:hypothetical protein